MDEACQLCETQARLTTLTVSDAPTEFLDIIKICGVCEKEMSTIPLKSDYWRFLTTPMWSENPAVKVTAYHLLTALKKHSWAQEALDMVYMEPELEDWAKAQEISEEISDETAAPTYDSRGVVLQNGDTVILIKDLAVKGAGFTAKRGTAVRSIRLTDNPAHVEGRINGQNIVLVAAFLKKTN